MRNYSLGRSAAVIPYYKDLNNYTGSVTATILMLQLEYWFSKTNGEQFFKFLEPCNRKDYKEGDSWVEDLGFSKYEFRTAFDKIGKTYKSKNEYLNSKDKFENKLYLSYYDRLERRTYYVRNHEKVDKILDEWISRKSTKSTSRSGESQSLEVDKVNLQKSQKLTSRSGKSQLPITVDYNRRLQQEITTVDYTEDTYVNSDELNSCTQDDSQELESFKDEKIAENKTTNTPYQKIVDLFNHICISLPSVQTLSPKRKTAIRKMWQFAKEDIEVIRALFEKTEESNFLTGRVKSWRADFNWIMRTDQAIEILEGKYDNRPNPTRAKPNNQTLTEQLQSQAVQDFINS